MVFSFFFAIFAATMLDDYKTNKLRVQQFGLTATVKDDRGKEHYFYRGHEYIEIGGVKWAVTNIGAEKETDGGLYFAFGEIQGYITEQVLKGKRKFNENEYTDVNFDAVKAHWGGKWRLPTEVEFRALIYSPNRWVENYEGSGVNGRLFTDTTDSSKKLFFPAVGLCHDNDVHSVGFLGFYWSSSLDTNNVTYGRHLHFNGWYSHIGNHFRRLNGFPIRGVVGD